MSNLEHQKILFVDDIPAFCDEVIGALQAAKLNADSIMSPLQAIPKIVSGKYSLVIVTLIMSELGGFEFIRRIRGAGCKVPLIMITGFGTEQSAIEAARLGVADYLTKPVKAAELVARVKRILQESSPSESSHPHSLDQMISSDIAMKNVFEKVKTVAPLNSRVLILGETGCGKQLLARAIHQESPRSKEPFVEVNCAAIPASLLESELFGHEEGSFTGASKKRVGRFETAAAGTIFLDEIGELSFDLQSKLLHVLDSGKFFRVGGDNEMQSTARLVSATNRDLIKEVELGRFRADLYYRLNVISVELPTLRDRPGDIPLLAKHFVSKFATEGTEPLNFTDAALGVLAEYHWPGNVRELQNVAEQLAVLLPGPQIEVTDLPERIRQQQILRSSQQSKIVPSKRLPFRDAKDQFEKSYLKSCIDEADGNLSEAARISQMDRAQFYRLSKRHGFTGKK